MGEESPETRLTKSEKKWNWEEMRNDTFDAATMSRGFSFYIYVLQYIIFLKYHILLCILQLDEIQFYWAQMGESLLSFVINQCENKGKWREKIIQCGSLSSFRIFMQLGCGFCFCFWASKLSQSEHSRCMFWVELWIVSYAVQNERKTKIYWTPMSLDKHMVLVIS